MLKLIGVALLVAAGVLGYLAYDAYQKENELARGVEGVFKDTPLKVEMERKVPGQTIACGIGGVFCLLIGVGLVIKRSG